MDSLNKEIVEKISLGQIATVIETTHTLAQFIRDLNTAGATLGEFYFDAHYPNPLGQMTFYSSSS